MCESSMLRKLLPNTQLEREVSQHPGTRADQHHASLDKESTLQNSIFVVNEEPYCIWEVDLSERNKEFLDGIDTEYFDYAIKVHLEADDEKRASIALRTTFHHAMETMYSLLGAYIQAPDCAYAWIAKCSNKELRELVSKVGAFHNSVFTKLNIENVSWDEVARSIFSRYMPGTDRNKKTAELFSSLWQRLAHEYTDQNHVNEYSSLKHGFRIRSGGFALAVGVEHEYGVPPPHDEMQLIGKSEFGTSFFRIEAIGNRKGNRSLRSRRTSINWKIEKVTLLAQLVSVSINNVVMALRIANGAKASTCKFLRPEEDSDFNKPWQYTPGVTSCNMDFVIDEAQIVAATKKELLEKLNGKEGEKPINRKRGS